MMMDDRMTRIRVLVGNGQPLPNELARDLLRDHDERSRLVIHAKTQITLLKSEVAYQRRLRQAGGGQ